MNPTQGESRFFKTVVLMLSLNDPFYLSQLYLGLCVIAAPGGGKSRYVGRSFALGLLQNVPELGGLILTAKKEETRNWIDYFKQAGREQDLIIFNSENGTFDPIWYEWNRGGRGRKSLEGIVELFSTLVSLNKHEGHGQDPFWQRGLEMLIRDALVILDLAEERVSIVNINKVIESLPTRPEEPDEATWQETSFCFRLISRIKARKDSLTEDEWNDLTVSTQHLFVAWPALDDRPRSSLSTMWSSAASRFLYAPYNRIFCSGECSFFPEMTMNDRKFILIDWPLLEVGEATGVFINVCLKLIFQRAWLRRDLADSPNPVVLWQDEFQYFVVPKFDNFFAETARGSRCGTVVMSQNILAISESMGESQPGSKTKSLLGNFGTKVFLQQNETESCLYAADQIGKEYRYIENYSSGSGGADKQTHFSSGGSSQLVHIIDPIEFTRLARPDIDRPYAQAIVYQSGTTFNASRTERNPKGSNFLSVFFSCE